MYQRRPMRPALLLIAVLWMVLVLLNGCATSLMSRAPLTRTMPLGGTPQEAYSQAAQAAARMGVQVQAADAQTRMLAGIVHGAVQLNVMVDAQSTVHVTCQLLPGKLVIGEMSECEDYIALLRKAVADAR